MDTISCKHIKTVLDFTYLVSPTISLTPRYIQNFYNRLTFRTNGYFSLLTEK